MAFEFLNMAPENPHLRCRKSCRPVAERAVPLAPRRFDVDTLPPDVRRVYHQLRAEVGEERALVFVFAMRTATELHRAWNLSLLTTVVLQRLKDVFDLRMTWQLGMFKLKLRAEDGGHELHDDVRYDYDSEFQDLYYGIAVALAEGHVDVHEGLRYQDQVFQQKKTAASGVLLIRNYPGRVMWYSFEAAMCAVIFFGGNWGDAAVAAITGLAAGLTDYALQLIGGRAGMFLDMLVGITTGIIGGLWYNHVTPCCLSSIFLATLYWFFYGTAFVIAVIELIAGEIDIGVTRLVAVSVKTFLLSLGAGVGLMISSWGGAAEIWFESEEQHCHADFLTGQWHRIPTYLLCSVAVLGQYHLPLDRHWLALCVMLAAYEAQYQVFHGVGEYFTTDHLDTAVSNIAGGAAGAITAHALCWLFDATTRLYSARLLHGDRDDGVLADLAYRWMRLQVQLIAALGIGRASDFQKLGLAQRLADQRRDLQDPAHTRSKLGLAQEDEELVLETVVGTMDTNVWSVLMPAVYQLVPGSIIAKLWFHSVFPPPLGHHSDSGSVFSNLMVIATSLALGLMFGFAAVQLFRACWVRCGGQPAAQLFGGPPGTRAKRDEEWVERAAESDTARSGSVDAGGTDPDSVAMHMQLKVPQDASSTDEDFPLVASPGSIESP